MVPLQAVSQQVVRRPFRDPLKHLRGLEIPKHVVRDPEADEKRFPEAFRRHRLFALDRDRRNGRLAGLPPAFSDGVQVADLGVAVIKRASHRFPLLFPSDGRNLFLRVPGHRPLAVDGHQLWQADLRAGDHLPGPIADGVDLAD